MKALIKLGMFFRDFGIRKFFDLDQIVSHQNARDTFNGNERVRKDDPICATASCSYSLGPLHCSPPRESVCCGAFD